MLNRGDVCLLEYPFTDRSAAKLRPALILQPFGRLFLELTGAGGSLKGADAIFVQITSKIREGEFNIILKRDNPWFASTGLRADSTIQCWNINTISKALVKRTIGKACPELMTRVDEKVRRVLCL